MSPERQALISEHVDRVARLYALCDRLGIAESGIFEVHTPRKSLGGHDVSLLEAEFLRIFAEQEVTRIGCKYWSRWEVTVEGVVFSASAKNDLPDGRALFRLPPLPNPREVSTLNPYSDVSHAAQIAEVSDVAV